MLLSQRRQRRSFYYAGVLNLGVALYPHRRSTASGSSGRPGPSR